MESAAETEATQTETTESAQVQTSVFTPPPRLVEEIDRGRILFLGDSRTVDMFSDLADHIDGRVEDNIVVYAWNARGYDYMAKTVDEYGHENFDTLVSFMGANDRGYFAPYANYYVTLLQEGKQLVLCTVGPTETEWLSEADSPSYGNEKMLAYNADLLEFAIVYNVPVIDTYGFIVEHIEIDPDGIHYLPRPTTELWEFILSNL